MEPTSKYYKDFSIVEQKLGLSFKNQDVLIQAFVHRSFLNENRDFPLGHNERLEFLGDAVLELVVTEYLYLNYGNPEGELTNWRASLVNSQMLGTLSSELGVEEFLYLSHGEQKDAQSKARMKILANLFEAIIGALYLEHGYAGCQEFILKHLLNRLEDILKHKLYLDPKTYFQETAQERLSVTPTYKVIHEEGPDHNKNFTVAVYLGEVEAGRGNGSSKQEAQVSAARTAIELKNW